MHSCTPVPQISYWLQWAVPYPPQNCPFLWSDSTPIETADFELTRPTTPSGIEIHSFPQITGQRHTHRLTVTESVENDLYQ